MPSNNNGTKRVAIVGAGGLGRELKSWISRQPTVEFIGFFDDDIRLKAVAGSPVLGGISELALYGREILNLVVAIGDPMIKQQLISRIISLGLDTVVFPSMTHPRSIVDDPESLLLGCGSVVAAGCVLTTNIKIGEHVLINLNSTLGHDVSIGDCSSIMPSVSLSGKVRVGAGVLVGTGARILEGITIGDGAKIGAGAVVRTDVPAYSTAVGVPAKIIQS